MRNLVFKFVLLSLFAVVGFGSRRRKNQPSAQRAAVSRRLGRKWNPTGGRRFRHRRRVRPESRQTRWRADGETEQRAVSLTGITVYANGVINFSVPGAGGIET
ncbi:MAG: hypothetical protein IPK58_19215 [Acidobacteria bacterium]|nr:hypothetical protein [Acidobacteriota bacterium]